jgi:hypothetical protein
MPTKPNNMKQLQLLAAILTLSLAVHAQGFFKTLPKIQEPMSMQNAFSFQPTVTPTDSIFCAFRPIVTAAMGITANKTTKAMAGTGISFQNLTYNYGTQKYYCNWSISALAMAGGAIAPTSTTEIMSYGLMLGMNNNNIGVGAFITGEKQKPGEKTKYYIGPMFTFNINFNNN